MRVLMFGWEFPPHISGGLGTASFGLARGLKATGETDLLFVVPKAYGDEDKSIAKIIGAGDIPISRKRIEMGKNSGKLDYIEVSSRIVPYVDPEDFWKLKSKEVSSDYKYVQTDKEGKIEFSGKYNENLLQEIANYAIVAEVIASQEDFDVIHAHDWLAYPAGISAKEASGKPLVIHVHATDFDRSGGRVNPDVFAIEKRGMNAADKIIAVSNLTRNTVIEKYGIPAEKVETVYNAVEPTGRKTTRRKLFSNSNEKIVTFLGRITMQKGPEYFIEAASRVLERVDNVRFVMAGSGDMMIDMIKMAASRNIADRFHFTGFLKGDAVFEMLEYSDVYIMPSVSEPFGISPLEAMQSNVPVIISHQSGVAEILSHAIKVNYWDVEAMADAIYGFVKYPALHSMFEKHGKKEVDQLKWENSARQVAGIYKGLL